ncbi:hypothetical protein QAD02_017458 [Eretmocerus hayati]|uniref:Uncharacterized protein n=1 Tax=Eretmocerus hayati TaxID=131215 RepID=A0ACC2PDX4_9HYME|nr:hypothetical protein QAD02_017458 [Eretmocerus hayati]
MRSTGIRRKKRHVYFFIANYSAHESISHLTNVTFHFFPPMTPVVQPMDKGVIRKFKKKVNVLELQECVSEFGNKCSYRRKTGFVHQFAASSDIQTAYGEDDLVPVYHGPYEEFVNTDVNLARHGDLTDAEIVAKVQNPIEEELDGEDDPEPAHTAGQPSQ